MKIAKLILLITIFICSININERTFAEANNITVYVKKEVGPINKKIFGNSFLAYDPMTYEDWAKEYYGYSDYGAGVWDPKWKEPVKEVMDLAKEAGITIVRFPSGCGTHHYNWKNAIGKNREHFLYGVDEFLKICKEIGAEAIITVSFFTGNENDAADLVEYLNSSNDGSNPNGGTDWAKERAKNGHPDPYGVRYFEIGNEVWHGDHRNIKAVSPEEYTRKYLRYYESMKAIDPSIEIGAVFYVPHWDRKVLEIIKDKLDFAIIHIFPSVDIDFDLNIEKLVNMDAKEIFKEIFSVSIVEMEQYLYNSLKLLREKTGKGIPLALTEYNGGFMCQEEPVPYRHCLGNALLNAELLRIFMQPELKVIIANYLNFSNSHTGMIKAETDFIKHDYRFPINYIKRPNFYVFELYHKYFGSMLVETVVSQNTSNSNKLEIYEQLKDTLLGGYIEGPNLLSGVRWKTRPFRGVKVEDHGDILSVEFIRPERGNYYHTIKTVTVEPNTLYFLSGFIRTENLKDTEGICLEAQDIRRWDKTHFAASTKRAKGTSDWIYVSKIFKTLPDAKGLQIIARRNSNKILFNGKAYFKDVSLLKYKLNDLSVNASKSIDGNKVYLMVINKNMDDSITTTIDLKNFVPSERSNAWVLNGLSIDATNKKNPNNVKVVHKQFKIKGNPFEFIFEPHALTAIEIERMK